MEEVGDDDQEVISTPMMSYLNDMQISLQARLEDVEFDLRNSLGGNQDFDVQELEAQRFEYLNSMETVMLATVFEKSCNESKPN